MDPRLRGDDTPHKSACLKCIIILLAGLRNFLAVVVCRGYYKVPHSMPITASAKKALRQSQRKHIRNAKQKNALKALVKAYRKALISGKKDEVAGLLPGIYKALDTAAKRGKILKKNTASRLKSRLAKSLARIS